MGDNSSSAAALDATPPGIVAVEGLRRGESVLAQAQYRQVVAVTEFYDLCCDEDERRGINLLTPVPTRPWRCRSHSASTNRW